MRHVGSWLVTGLAVVGLGSLPSLGSCALSKRLGELQGGEGGSAGEGGDADQGENTGGTGGGATTNSAGSSGSVSAEGGGHAAEGGHADQGENTGGTGLGGATDSAGSSGSVSAGSGGATGGSVSAGSGGSTGGTGGSVSAGSGGSTGGTGPAPPVPGVDCDWPTALQKNCAISVCHSARSPFAGLNLIPDDQLISRIKDVPVTLEDMDCDPGEQYYECVSPPPECNPYLGAKLVDSADPEASFILAKLNGSGCGNQEPLPPGDAPSAGWSAERRACLESLVRGIAALP
jgi:hypothetical protein